MATSLRTLRSCTVPSMGILLLAGCFPGPPDAPQDTILGSAAFTTTAGGEPTTTAGPSVDTTSTSSDTTSESLDTTSELPDMTDDSSEATGGTSGTQGSFCGDGVLDDGEECDDGNKVDADACTAECKDAVCGDGIVGPGEGCDDANQIDNDGCRNNCALPDCGDGIVQLGEECDDGNLSDADDCLTTCKDAECGDGEVHEDDEECDDGDQDNIDECTNECTLPECGDSIIQEWLEEQCDDGSSNDPNDYCNDCKLRCGNGNVDDGEECDDGQGNADDSKFCSSTCKRTSLLVFVTEKKYSANLGGLVGADNQCVAAALLADLRGPSNYVAWLSDKTTGAGTRAKPGVKWQNLPYRTLKGAQVASNYELFKTKNHGAAINVTENLNEVLGGVAFCDSATDQHVWTGTESNFFGPDGHTCDGWTSNSQNFSGVVGRADKPTWEWNGQCFQDCNATARLYCIETPK